MRQNSIPRFTAAAATFLALVLALTANAQTPVSLQEQLNAQYKLAQLDGNGTVIEAGTLLAVEKGGITSVPWNGGRGLLCAAKFQDKTLHPSNGLCANMMKNVAQYYQKGAKVYPTKINVNLEKAKISFQVVACDSCNGVDPPTGMRGEVAFQFAKGYLEKAGAAEVEDTIGQVFSISGDDQQQGQGGGQQTQGGGQQGAPAGQDQSGGQGQQQQGEPQTVQLGMTTDRVKATLGAPNKVFDLGAKQIYVYSDVKVTFINGKVSDVQ
jgi:hypothetical protein